MENIKYHKIEFTAEVYLYKTKDGGRKVPIMPNYLGIIIEKNEKFYESWLLIKEPFLPGQKRIITVILVCPIEHSDFFIVGEEFYLIEATRKGTGKIIDVKSIEDMSV